MRLRRYTRLAEDRVACGDYMLFLFCHPGGFGAFGATYCLWLLVCYGETMRLRRYTRLVGDRVACGDYMLFCFAIRVGLAHAALYSA